MFDKKTFVYLVIQTTWFVSLSQGWLFSTDNNCYDTPNVGCFSIARPFTNAMGFAPHSPEEVNVNFIYATPARWMRFSLDQTQQIMASHFNPSLKTVFIIHGYYETPNKPWIGAMVNGLKRQPPMNIFVVDWSEGARTFNYFQCVANARMAGAVIALFLQELISLGASPSSFHVIGFSLGSQVAGYVGSRVSGVGRITGLDPAGPGFIGTDPIVRLDATDAIVVDVVHTDNEFGALMPSGTVDFYPNGGLNQPACGSDAMSRLSSFIAGMDFSRRSMTRSIGCSHIRAPELFTASINHPCTFSIKRCQTVRSMSSNHGAPCTGGACPRFGYHLNSSGTPRPGLYRFATRGTFPYCYHCWGQPYDQP